MILKLIKLPFWLTSKGVGAVASIIKTVLDLFIWMGRFIFSRGFGVLIGVIAGLLLGRKHINVKWFAGKKSKR